MIQSGADYGIALAIAACSIDRSTGQQIKRIGSVLPIEDLQRFPERAAFKWENHQRTTSESGRAFADGMRPEQDKLLRLELPRGFFGEMA